MTVTTFGGTAALPGRYSYDSSTGKTTTISSGSSSGSSSNSSSSHSSSSSSSGSSSTPAPAGKTVLGTYGGGTTGLPLTTVYSDGSTQVTAPATTPNTAPTPTITPTPNTPNGNAVTALPSTGSANLDALQTEFQNSIKGSLSAGFTINPALSINMDTVKQFISDTASQLNPRYQQTLAQEKIGIDQAINKTAVEYGNKQGETVQDYQQTLGTIRNASGANGTYLGGGQRALERGLTNSANRALSTLDVGAATDIGSALQSGGMAVGQGIMGSNGGGVNVPGASGVNASSFNIPSLYGRTLSASGGNSVFAGSANQGNALDYKYNPSTYQYGSIPADYANNFSNLLNQTTNNYIQGQVATGGVNQVLSSYGRTLAGLN